jgi:hypothetical protein
LSQLVFLANVAVVTLLISWLFNRTKGACSIAIWAHFGFNFWGQFLPAPYDNIIFQIWDIGNIVVYIDSWFFSSFILCGVLFGMILLDHYKFDVSWIEVRGDPWED